jgi:hypothetical protein
LELFSLVRKGRLLPGGLFVFPSISSRLPIFDTQGFFTGGNPFQFQANSSALDQAEAIMFCKDAAQPYRQAKDLDRPKIFEVSAARNYLVRLRPRKFTKAACWNLYALDSLPAKSEKEYETVSAVAMGVPAR